MNARLHPIVSAPVFAILYSYTALGVCFVLILSWLGLKRPVMVIFKLWAKSVFVIMGKKFEIHGKENISREKRYVLVANHGSLFDIIAIVSFYPDISWFGHERLLRIPLFRRILKMTDYVPFREPSYRNTREMIEQLVNKSGSRTIAIFPEGTRTLNGKINSFYRGFIYLCRIRDLDILPVTLNGFYDLKPKNRSYINFNSKLDVIIHKPIKKEELEGKNDTEIINTVRGIIQSSYHK